jgi:hypothetical protein
VHVVDTAPSAESATVQSPPTAVGASLHVQSDGQSLAALHGMAFAWQCDVERSVHEQLDAGPLPLAAGGGCAGVAPMPGGAALPVDRVTAVAVPDGATPVPPEPEHSQV